MSSLLFLAAGCGVLAGFLTGLLVGGALSARSRRYPESGELVTEMRPSHRAAAGIRLREPVPFRNERIR